MLRLQQDGIIAMFGVIAKCIIIMIQSSVNYFHLYG